MKNLTKTLFLFLSFSQAVFSQIVINPKAWYQNANISSGESKMSITTDASGINFLPLSHSSTGNIGISTTFFTSLLAIAPMYINEGKFHIRHNSTTSNNSNSDGPHLILDEYESNDFARLRFRQSYSNTSYYPFYTNTYVRGARYWDIAGFANGTSTAEDKLHFQNSGANILTLRGDGNVGVLNDNPTLPFQINSSITSSNSSTGTAAIGPLSGQHIMFGNNRINAYNSTYAADLFLNDVSTGNVRVGTTSNSSNLVVSGYTRLGELTAPSIKMKKLTGTTGANSGDVIEIGHGIVNASKILAIDIHVNYSGNSWVEPNYQYGTSSIRFMYTYDNNNITIKNALTSEGSAITNKPIVILVTYQE